MGCCINAQVQVDVVHYTSRDICTEVTPSFCALSIKLLSK